MVRIHSLTDLPQRSIECPRLTKNNQGFERLVLKALEKSISQMGKYIQGYQNAYLNATKKLSRDCTKCLEN